MPPLDRYSFPSGHTLHAVCFAWQAVAHFPALSWTLVPVAALIALSRVVLGLHYPTDVLAGAAIGALLAACGSGAGSRPGRGMRVLLLSDVYFPRVNGVSTSIATFRADLATIGVETTLVVPQYDAEPDSGDDPEIRTRARQARAAGSGGSSSCEWRCSCWPPCRLSARSRSRWCTSTRRSWLTMPGCGSRARLAFP